MTAKVKRREFITLLGGAAAGRAAARPSARQVRCIVRHYDRAGEKKPIVETHGPDHAVIFAQCMGSQHDSICCII